LGPGLLGHLIACFCFHSWETMDPARDGRSGPGPRLGDSLRLLLQETSAFKQQNPGKFCLLVCSLCTFSALLGRYVPGTLVSYLLVVALFLWPLVSSHDVALWLKPALQKLDFGVGEFLQKKRRVSQAQREQENVESDLSSMFPKVSKGHSQKEMSVSDTEASELTWTDNGTFNLSEGHTPQTENSEDLDREEVFTPSFPEFPSLDNGTTTNGDEDDEHGFSFASSAPQPEEPKAFNNTAAPPGEQPAHRALELVTQRAADLVTATVTAAIQGQIEAAVGLATAGLLELAEESDSDVEDFELLDQSELERLEGELGLGAGPAQAPEAVPAPAGSSGFLSKLLRRH
uniref:Reticulophagy regulator 1 n=1 Tax=Tetraodon nigroviridis TaxID=99883 RepID=H3CRD7_TETNG